jgi:sporulation protein YlmC with PRC-barrel domain
VGDEMSPHEEDFDMLRSLKILERYKVHAIDGDIGRVVDFLMDDVSWAIRYLVVDTGGMLDGRQVLISPVSFGEVDFSASRFRLTVTKEKVKNSPSVDVDLPVSRQHEREYQRYYEYTDYWGYGGLWGAGAYPSAIASRGQEPPHPTSEKPADVHLRSAKELAGYHIEASDDTVGHVSDFVVDDETWKVRYLVVRTSNWLPGKSVLIAPEWATNISWLDRRVHVEMTRDAIKRSPEWSATYPIQGAYEDELYRHYGRIPGWARRDRSFEANAPRRTGGPRP